MIKQVHDKGRYDMRLYINVPGHRTGIKLVIEVFLIVFLLTGEELFTSNKEEYATAMIERYGEDVSQHPSTQGGSKFGIGSSDSNFVVTGAPSLSSGSTPSYVEYQRSQGKVRDLQSQVEELHNRVEDVQQKMREEVQHHMSEEIQQVREEMKEEMQ
ncbi:hypothetical protein R6Q57_006373 [Mikania cordata]